MTAVGKAQQTLATVVNGSHSSGATTSSGSMSSRRPL